MEVAEQNAEIAGLPVRWLQAGDAPVLYLHGVPNSAEIWLPFLNRNGGIAPDLPGFGRSGKGGDFDYSIAGYDRFLEAFAEHVGLDRFALVMHDWGAVGLAPAQRFPERVERLALINAVPFVPGYRWHRVARIWRTPMAGELLMGMSTKWGLRRVLPDELVDEVWRHFDQGTQRAILRLYRSAPEEVLARTGEDLGKIVCPALVVWGTRDPYLPDELAQRYADALGGEADVELLDGGHWLWLDRPELVERVSEFMV
jgi:pimeloyl-ACP methyl ester carboxylesterase